MPSFCGAETEGYMQEKKRIPELLLEWYRRVRRDLPWRDTDDPYRIWVSEIILQQTRVVQGTAYYHRFLERFPDVGALAAARVDEVLKVWEGLGYYSRARNMHAAARSVMEEYDGHFPDRYEKLLQLKGVGPYTAAAIASIAFGEAVPVLDGNVFRVIARLFAIDLPRGGAGDRKVREITRQLIPGEAPGDFNQALMELGALVCTPGNPDCDSCPLKGECLARKKRLTGSLPRSSPPPPIKKRYFHYLVVSCCGEILINQRSGKDIWQLLWEFPVTETKNTVPPARVIRGFEEKIPGITGTNEPLLSELILHQLTHRTLLVRFYHVTLSRWPDGLDGEYVKIATSRLKEFAFPRLITGYIESFPERFGF
jgi:A/G-specific adenine glycosylase